MTPGRGASAAPRGRRKQSQAAAAPPPTTTTTTATTQQKIGADLARPEGYDEGMRETHGTRMSDKNRKDYRRRLEKIMAFWEEKDPDYYNQPAVKILTEAERNDPDKYYFNSKRDIIYAGLNEVHLMNFFVKNTRHAPTEKFPEGQLKSREDIRKYKNAVVWGAAMAKVQLDPDVENAMTEFVRSFRHQYTNAKKKGEVEEKSADPIPSPLYKLICQWALEESNIMVWFWTIAQWNFVARSASIDPLKLSNLKLGTDSIIGKYDDTKTQKAGERLSEKNIYAQPFDWKICFWTALGVWLALRVDEMKNSNQKLFLNKKSKEGSASTKYCEQLSSIVKRHMAVVQQHMEGSRFNPYGFRKGSATSAVAGTTMPPSLPSIARRGEWSIGSVLDVYWHFGSEQDHYLGRILADFDPNHETFATLPPHWSMMDPMEDDDVAAAMKMTFGALLEEHPKHVPLFCRLMACIVFHSDDMVAMMVQHKGHAFTKLAILQDTDLLRKLHPKVTLDPTPGVIEKATGVPPHVHLAQQMSTVRDKLESLCELMVAQTTQLVETVKQAIEEKSFENGQVSRQQLIEVMQDFKRDTLESVTAKLDDMKRLIRPTGAANNDPTQHSQQERTGGDFWYADNDGQVKLHFVPKDFKLPSKPKLREGLNLWLKGQTLSADGSTFVRPFRRFKTNGKFHGIFSNELKRAFKSQWGIFEYLEKHIEDRLPSDTKAMSVEEIEAYFQKCVDVLQTRVSYCFEGSCDNPIGNWAIGNWTNKTQFSSIQDRGTASDKALLPAAGNRNRAHPGLKRKRSQKPAALYTNRQQIRQARRAPQGGNDVTAPVGGGTFEAAFAGVDTEGHSERDAQLRQVVQDEMAVEQQAAQANRNRLGDGVGTDGTRLYAVDRGGIRQNYAPDSSIVERDNYRRRLERHLNND